jgi:hypothetical protein
MFIVYSGKIVISLHMKIVEPHMREKYRPGVQEKRNEWA